MALARAVDQGREQGLMSDYRKLLRAEPCELRALRPGQCEGTDSLVALARAVDQGREQGLKSDYRKLLRAEPCELRALRPGKRGHRPPGGAGARGGRVRARRGRRAAAVRRQDHWRRLWRCAHPVGFPTSLQR